MMLEQLAQARDQDTWNDLMSPALAQLNCEIIQSTSDEASGLLAYVEPHLGAPHSPDLFHIQYELSKAVCTPLATKKRAAGKAITGAKEQRNQVQTHLDSAGDQPDKCDPGHPPKVPRDCMEKDRIARLDHAKHEKPQGIDFTG